jgi:hypothetical protein
MDDEKRALTLGQAMQDGLIAEDYSYTDLPNDFSATLEYKVWGNKRNLKLFFCCDNGDKYVISVFLKNYSPKKMPELNLSSADIKTGMRFRLKIEVNKNRNVNLLEAHTI